MVDARNAVPAGLVSVREEPLVVVSVPEHVALHVLCVSAYSPHCQSDSRLKPSSTGLWAGGWLRQLISFRLRERHLLLSKPSQVCDILALDAATCEEC